MVKKGLLVIIPIRINRIVNFNNQEETVIIGIMKDINVSNIGYKIKSKTILTDISFTVDTEDSFALLGENGSGKTTLIDIILNDIKPTTGSVNFFEKPYKNYDKVGVLYDQLPLFPMLKVSESIHYFTSIHQLNYHTISEQYFDTFEIHKIKNTLVTALSQGEKKRLSILLAIIHNPRLLILDEPFANLDPTITDRIWNTIKDGNRTIFFSTHDWKEAEKQATKIGFIHDGKIIQPPQSPMQLMQALPALKKISVSNINGLTDELIDYQYYMHDGYLSIFFDEKTDLLKKISLNTSNFSVQNVSLQDAYLFTIKKQKND